MELLNKSAKMNLTLGWPHSSEIRVSEPCHAGWFDHLVQRRKSRRFVKVLPLIEHMRLQPTFLRHTEAWTAEHPERIPENEIYLTNTSIW